MAEVQDANAASEPSMEEILASIRKIIADEKEPEPEPAAAAPAAEEDVLELTQMVQDDGSVVDLAAAAPPPPEPPAPVPAPAPVPEPEPEPEIPPMPEPPPKPQEPEEPLISDMAATVVSSTLAALANTVHVEKMAALPGMTPFGNGARTLEEMVLELMRPMLKSWLDQNLPPIVERLVQKEVERIARRAAD